MTLRSRDRTILAVAVACSTSIVGYGQEAPIVGPGSPTLNASIIQPFEADYDQQGTLMTIRVIRSEGDNPVLTALMITDGPNGPGVDQIGHSARDLRFAYRRFGFNRWRYEYVNAELTDDVLVISRMPLPADGEGTHSTRTEVDRGFVDGTFGHFLLAALPLAEGYSARLVTWRLLENGADVAPRSPITVVGREPVVALDGETYDCWVVEARVAEAAIRDYVIQRPPYLIQQVMMHADGDPVVTLALRGVIERRYR